MYLPTIWNVQVVAAEHCLPRSLSYLHAPCGGNLMWWLWHRLQWRQWQEAKAAQVPLLFTIQMIFFFFFLHYLSLLFLKKRQGKSPHTLCFRLVWDTREIQEIKCPQTALSLPTTSAPSSSTLHLLWTIEHNTIHWWLFWLMRICFYLDFFSTEIPFKM